jgi:N-acetylneuraminic acid mutarotase
VSPGLAEAQSVVVGGKLYVMGGYNVTLPDYQPTNAVESFDPSTNTWTSLATMPAAETHMGVATDGTYIYVAGGYTFDPVTTYQTFATTNVFRYDIAANAWSSFTPLLPAARGAGALAYLAGQLHFVDGVDATRVGYTEHWVLNPSDSNPQWATYVSLPETANHTAAVVLNGDLVVVGGQSTSVDSTTIAHVWEWDPNNPGQWTALASMPYRASHAVVAVIDNRIIVMGGTTANDAPLDSVIVYDPDTNSWSDQTPLPDNGRLAAVGGVIGNEIIVATGFGNGNLQAQTWAAVAT